MTTLHEHDAPPYSVTKLARRWECSPSMVRKMIDSGRLQVFRLGVLIRISAVEVERFECQQSQNIPSSGSEEALPSSGEDQEAKPTPQSSDTGSNSNRKIARARKRRGVPSGKGATIVHGPWAAS
jgi:excisionase family DNA binding protein